MDDFYGEDTRSNQWDDMYERDYDDSCDQRDYGDYPDYADFDDDDAEDYAMEDQWLDGSYEDS